MNVTRYPPKSQKMLVNIYDGRNPCLLDNNSTDIEATTPRQALQKYLNNHGEGKVNFYNTSDNDVIWKTTPFVMRDGRKYQTGRISWWGIKPIKLS